jgi:hypothetical protein
MEEQPESTELSLIRATPVFARLAVGASLRTAQWGVGLSLRAGSRFLRAAVSGESAGQFVDETTAELRLFARKLLSMDAEGHIVDAEVVPDDEPADRQSLRDRGAELLRQSADIGYDEDSHPAFDRILGDLAPDEARILRLLSAEGAQPAVDVRESKPLNLGSQMVKPGLTMIGAAAGCRYLDRVPSYLNNLNRLGLIWFSREPLPDPLQYQVLEAQPEVLEAMRTAGRAKTVRRAIELTPFGADFCAVCLPSAPQDGDVEAGPADRTHRPQP